MLVTIYEVKHGLICAHLHACLEAGSLSVLMNWRTAPLPPCIQTDQIHAFRLYVWELRQLPSHIDGTMAAPTPTPSDTQHPRTPT
eukprot:scaffold212217_cov21-Tisochrysis_lutea.AAC.1